MRYDFGRIIATSIGDELIYSFVIIVASLMIYFGTRELYELSTHKGIKYFRQAFLFFAIAYFFRTFIKVLLVYFGVNEIFVLNPKFIGAITLILFIYAGTMAALLLVCSMMWKKWSWIDGKVALLHFVAVVAAFLGVIYHSIEFLLGLNVILFAAVTYSSYSSYKDSRKRSGQNLFLIYVLLFTFWILNLYETLVPRFFGATKILIYFVSIMIFLTISYKVLRRAGAN